MIDERMEGQRKGREIQVISGKRLKRGGMMMEMKGVSRDETESDRGKERKEKGTKQQG